jgi:mannose-1-phosphate guanylyltransferase
MPKQLLPIVGRRSMLQDTLARVSPPVASDRILVVTGRSQAASVRRQLPRLERRRVLVEPRGRNTAAAIALAALRVERECPDGVLVVLPADHLIGDLARFRRDLALGFDVAERTGALVTFGVRPTRVETGYGHIRVGRPVRGLGGRVARVAAFIEKPPRARAEALLAEAGVLWNAGIFAWRVQAILAALRQHLPAVVEPLAAALGSDRVSLAEVYRRLPSVSIDTGVLERARDVAVIRARFTWSDVGSWAALESVWAGGGDGGNAVCGRALAVDSSGCIVDSPKRLVALLGVRDLVVVDTADAVLICPKTRAQDVRLIVDELRRRRLGRYL